MNYDTQRALDGKADKWEVFDLKSKVDSLSRDLRTANDEIRRSREQFYDLENKLMRLREALMRTSPEDLDYQYLADTLT